MEVPGHWKLANVTPSYKKGWKEKPGCQPDLVVREGHGVIILSAIMSHVQDSQGFRPGQPGFMQGRSCLTNMIIFYDEVTCVVDEGKALDIVYLDFSKAFCNIQPLKGKDQTKFVNAFGRKEQQK